MNRRAGRLRLTLVTTLAAFFAFAAARSSSARQTEPSRDEPATSQPSTPTTQEADAKPTHESPGVGGTYPGVPKPAIVLKPGETPAIEFDAPVFDFGRHSDDSEVKHEFKFTNTGTGPLEILKVQPSCGCTLAGKFDRIVQPGDAGAIPVTFRTKKLEGQVSKKITVFTNVPTQDRLTLEIGGFVWLPLQATPKRATFGILKIEQAVEGVLRKLTLQSNVESPVNITGVHSTNPVFSPEIKVLDPGRQFELTISLKGQVPPGSHRGRIEFSTGLEERPTVEIHVDAYIQADVDVMPAKISLSPGRKRDMTRRLIVRNGTETPLEVTQVTTTDPVLTTSLEETNRGTQYLVTLTIPKDYIPPPDGDAIVIDTNSTTMPRVTVPVELRSPTSPARQDGKPPRIIPRPSRPAPPQDAATTEPIQEQEQKPERADRDSGRTGY
ncbi:MAG: DUF1573 domain-containing protein [Planctomycetota bacterium]